MSLDIQVNSIVFDTWTVKREIGAGSFGKVFEIQREDFGEVYTAALKVITVPQSDAELKSAFDEGMGEAQVEEYFYGVVQSVVREFAIMAKLKGTGNVVNYEDHVVIRHQGKIGWDILIRMELLTPLLPYAYAHPFSRRDVIKLGIDICKALELCQKYNVIHRDIKPENIFVSENGDFKLGDFGIARTIESVASDLSRKGTYNYMAPEVYRGAEYGFSVDLYSLGLVLYRLLNKNRLPFYALNEPISHEMKERALIKRMSGQPFDAPFHAQGRLVEIIQKACAFDPGQRYSSPAQMRQELEAILYDQKDSELIYPDGDELVISENEYLSRKTAKNKTIDGEIDKTESASGKKFDLSQADRFDASRTESAFGRMQERPDSVLDEDKTESVFSRSIRTSGKRQQGTKTKTGTAVASPKVSPTGRKKIWVIAAVCIVLVASVGVGGVLLHIRSQKAAEEEKQARYQTVMQQADGLCDTEPEQALSLYKEAQELYPEEVTPYVSYAYALYRNGDYQGCVTYIEDDLALGKEYEPAVQSQLSEILGAAYFELDDYAAAASFFRLSTAGGDITVSAMRDYAVSLGRLGSIDEANDVLQRMFDAGADDDVTNYVQAEVDYAQKNYVEAESRFEAVLNTTEDVTLQKRALRSLAEVYRDCSGLARTGQSPISTPATKEAELLANGIVQYGLRHDSTLWEMLALAYYEAYNTDPDVPPEYLTRAAECFEQVLELGVVKDYLYTNLYTIYYGQGDYSAAENALEEYKTAFPDSYMPHALRGMLLITIENEKPQSGRDYSQARTEYETAGNMIRGSDDAAYYQQLESLIRNLEQSGWL